SGRRTWRTLAQTPRTVALPACTADPQTPRDPLLDGGARLATRAWLRSANRCREESPARELHHRDLGHEGGFAAGQPPDARRCGSTSRVGETDLSARMSCWKAIGSRFALRASATAVRSRTFLRQWQRNAMVSRPSRRSTLRSGLRTGTWIARSSRSQRAKSLDTSLS